MKNIVLLRFAFSDAPRWGKVIKLLQTKSYHAAALQNPLTSLAGEFAAKAMPSSLTLSDVAATVRRLDDGRASVFISRVGGAFGNFNNLKSCPAASYVEPHRFVIHLARGLHDR